VVIAEAFVLLALDADGRVAAGPSKQHAAAVGVTGALISELAQLGHLDLTDGIIRTTGSMPENPQLAQALENLRPFEGKKLGRRRVSLTQTTWTQVVDAMVASGTLGRKESRLRMTRHPVVDRGAHERLLQEVRQAATGDGPLDPRMATLLALAGPAEMLAVVAPDRADRPAALRRMAAAADQVPLAFAVRHVLAAMDKAVAAASFAPADTG
jgi:hypothetical protein